jgi:hypothetical protein
MSFQILTTDQIDPSLTTKRKVWVGYSSSAGFFKDVDITKDGSEPNWITFTKNLQEAFVFSDFELAQDFSTDEDIKSSYPDMGFLELNCSL